MVAPSRAEILHLTEDRCRATQIHPSSHYRNRYIWCKVGGKTTRIVIGRRLRDNAGKARELLGGPQDRRSPRIPTELNVRVVGPKGSTDYTTYDVSRGGVFIKTDEPKSMRQLLRLEILIGDDEKNMIEAHGMVVHTISEAEAADREEPPGMGIEFIAFGGDPRQRWEDYLRNAPSTSKPSSPAPIPSGPPRQALTPSPTPGVVTASPAPPAPQPSPGIQAKPSPGPSAIAKAAKGQVASDVKIRHKRSKKKKKIVRHIFPIPLQEVEQLYEIYERDFSAGTIFIYTTEKIPVGERVSARVIHPINLDEFDIHGKVQLIHDDPQYPGLTLAIRPSTLARREKYRAFIEAGLPVEDVSMMIEDE